METELIDLAARSDEADVAQQVVQRLRNGGVVVLPTETVYGAAGLLNHPQAAQRLQGLRGGGDGRPMTIHLGRPQQANQYLHEVNDFAQRLMRKLWPGPVGLMFDVPAQRRAAVAAKLKVPQGQLYDLSELRQEQPAGATDGADGGTITLRCPDHPFTSEVLSAIDGPIALTMADPSAAGPHPRVAQLAAELQGKVEMVIDAGPTRYTKPSTLLRVYRDRYKVVRAGVYDERIIARLLRTTILFVCSGNTCRSPMAEALARRILAQKLHVSEMELESKGITVVSAGSFAMPGARATPAAVEAVRQLGADLSRHRSQPLTVELIHSADAIYAMGRGHAAAVAALVPSAASRVWTLDPAGDIEDPIGADASVYKELAGQLQTLIEQRLQEQSIS